MAYSYIELNNISNPEILFTDVPNNKLFASVEYTIAKKIMINLFGEYDSRRNSASDGTRVSPGYFLMNGQVTYSFLKFLKAEFGVNNIFDKNYTIEEGYPQPGRNFYISLYFNL